MRIYQTARTAVTALAIAVSTIACDPGPGPTPILAVSTIFPNVGVAGSATEIRIKGTGFKSDAIVTVGGALATDVSVIDSGTIAAKTPALGLGKVDVNVSNPGGGSATLPGAFEFLAPIEPVPMQLLSVSPDKSGAGWVLTIVGTGFRPGAIVTFGGVPGTNTNVESQTRIFVNIPRLPGGPTDVTVTNPNGESVTRPSAFMCLLVTLSASASSVAAGGAFEITWDSPFWFPPEGWPWDDRIGLFPAGAPDAASAAVWLWHSPSAKGTLTLSAPTAPGAYELRYLSGGAIQATVSLVVPGPSSAR